MVCSLIKAALMDLVKSKGRNIALQQVLKAPLRGVGSMSWLSSAEPLCVRGTVCIRWEAVHQTGPQTIHSLAQLWSEGVEPAGLSTLNLLSLSYTNRVGGGHLIMLPRMRMPVNTGGKAR